MSTIICPLCKKDISEALKLQVEEEVFAKQKEFLKIERENAKKEAFEEAAKKIKVQFELQLKQSNDEALAKEEQNKKLLEQLTQLTIQLRELKNERDESKLEMQKKLAEEEDKIKLEERKKAEDFTKREKQKWEIEKKELIIQLESVKKAHEEANKKGGSKSQQLQGEAMEVIVFNTLTKAFPHDDIKDVAKGVSGADILHVVKSPRGYPCGSILWECKRAEWNEKKFIDKLKVDQRTEGSSLAVIVSVNMPKDAIDGFINRGDDIWICSLPHIAPIAVALRKMLLDAAYQRALAVNRGEKKEDLFSYITSAEFVQSVKTIVEVYNEIFQQVAKERAAYEKLWKQRESQAQRIIDSMANIVGKIQGKIGASSLQIKELELIESGEQKST